MNLRISAFLIVLAFNLPAYAEKPKDNSMIYSLLMDLTYIYNSDYLNDECTFLDKDSSARLKENIDRIELSLASRVSRNQFVILQDQAKNHMSVSGCTDINKSKITATLKSSNDWVAHINETNIATALSFSKSNPLIAPASECADSVEPVVININKLIYPEHEKKLGITGTTVLEITIDATGNLLELIIVKSSGNRNLDRAAIHAGRYSRFSPGKCNNVNVGGKVVVPLVFS